MNPAATSGSTAHRPRVGIPWRTSRDETKGSRPEDYEQAVRRAGGEPILLSLANPVELRGILPSLDAFVLPGSPADVEPTEYGAANGGLSAPADLPREEADRAVLKHALAEKKPVLAICYGCQMLNVYLGGTLIQDLRTEMGTTTPHRKKDIAPEPASDPQHGATFEPGSRLAHAGDGTVEGVEWTGDSNWVTGVQWHPERMFGDAGAERLFSDFIAAARAAVAPKA
jgi:putative glutamine amidotransferase